MAQQHSLLGLPYQLLVDNILGYLDAQSLRHLRQVSQAAQDLADDELVWRRRIAQDFNFPIFNSARVSGWQKLFKGLSKPFIYTFGDFTHDRLGFELDSKSLTQETWGIITRTRGVPFPVPVEWKKAPLHVNDVEKWDDSDVDMVDGGEDDLLKTGEDPVEPPEGTMGVPVQIHAGGWSFFALTDRGQILAWGSSDDTYETTIKDSTFKTPRHLSLGNRKARMLSVGRQHLVALMEDNALYEWSRNWDRATVVDLPRLFGKTSNSSVRPIQLEAGWDFTACLAEIKDSTAEGNRGEEEDEGETDPIATTSAAAAAARKTHIVFWKTDWIHTYSERYLRPAFKTTIGGEWVPQPFSFEGVMLPPLGKRISKIAAGDNFILALTEDSLVYAISLPPLPDAVDRALKELDNLVTPQDPGDGVAQMRSIRAVIGRATDAYETMIRRRQMEWTLLDIFCRDLKASGMKKDGHNVWDDNERLKHLITSETKITHISAQFHNFAVYAPDAGSADATEAGHPSRGIVILGNKKKFEEAIVIPSLQGKQVIKVSHGDWHHGALTLDGHVFTWGERANGALGSWDALPVPDNAISTLNTASTLGFVPQQQRGFFRFWNEAPARQMHFRSSTSTEKMVEAEKRRYDLREMPARVKDPLPVRFGFAHIGDRKKDGEPVTAQDKYETKYVFDIAFAGWHSGALAIDRDLLLSPG